jgi:hypothetical protein
MYGTMSYFREFAGSGQSAKTSGSLEKHEVCATRSNRRLKRVELIRGARIT